MSCWMVPKEHIDMLLTAARACKERPSGVGSKEECSATGQMLWDANRRSVNERYGEEKKAPRYQFEAIPGKVRWGDAAQGIRCLEYQSCDAESWAGCSAAKWLEELADGILWTLADNDTGAAWPFESSDAWVEADRA